MPPGLSPERLNRARLYVLIDALEQDGRDLLRTWVVPFTGEEVAAGSFAPAAAERRATAGSGDPSESLLDYLFLGDLVGLLNARSEYLPAEYRQAVRSLTPELERLVPVRNRVMHGRPLLSGDGDTVARTVALLLETEVRLPSLEQSAQHLVQDPDWTPLFEAAANGGRVLHNLPLPDFDESGLIGRGRENRELLRLLRDDRATVITVVGEGGVGKTALAVKALYDLIDDANCPYEAVLWASAKTERLTGEGVELLTQAATGLSGIASRLGEPLVEGVEDVGLLASLIAGIPTLLVVDNVETVDADEVVRLVDAMPRETRFLFTSRVGLGQLERRLPVLPLDPDQAGFLLRRLAIVRGLPHLAHLADAATQRMTERLRRSPLAIKWFVVAVEGGADPDSLLANQGEVLDFCLTSVYSRLSPDAMLVAQVLATSGRPLSYAELAILADLPMDRLRFATQQLQRSAILELSTRSPSDATQLYGITATAQQYLQTVARVPGAVADEVRKRDTELRTAEEDRRRRMRVRSLAPGVVWTRSEADSAVAALLMGAFTAAHEARPDEADELLARARSISPDFSEVFRVAAFIQSERGNIDEATASYRRALELAEGELADVAAYFFAGHLVRGARQPELALPYAEQAHAGLADVVTAIRLGEVCKYLGQFARARELLGEALEGSEGRSHLIAASNLVDLAKREAEHLLDQSQAESALRAGLSGIRAGQRTLDAGYVDRRLLDDLFECVAETLGAAQVVADLESVHPELAEVLGVLIRYSAEWRRQRQWGYLESRLRRLVFRADLCDEHRALVRDVLEGSVAQGVRYEGVIERFHPNQGWGYIRRPNLPNLFFHRQQLVAQQQAVFLVVGAPVSFALGQNDRGPVATEIEIDEVEALLLKRHRRGRVTMIDERFAFLQDAATGASVFMPRQAAGPLWDDLRDGNDVEYELVIGTRGPKVGIARSPASPAVS